MTDVVILGAGIAGISSGYHLHKQGYDVILYERDDDWGGLCRNFTINGFRFDRFVHFSFTENPETKAVFENSSPMYSHPSKASNYYKGVWIKHPAQNNLAPLPAEEKINIIESFIKRKIVPVRNIKNYAQWLEVQYGKYFAHNFPFKYTKKYWGLKPNELGTKWVGKRMYSPDIKQILQGAFEENSENFYYTSYMRYPYKGGFRSILNNCRKPLNIRLNKEVVFIDTVSKIVKFKDGTTDTYKKLISSIPMPEIVKLIDNTPKKVLNAAKRLHHTSGFMVSIGLNKPDIPKHLWFYIYDEDVMAARVHSPSLKSRDNVPEGCSSLQAEIFFDCKAKIPKKEAVLENTINKLIDMSVFKAEDIVLTDIRFEKYANVTFDKNIYKNRKIIQDFLNSKEIINIGRFGKWEYMWSHQVFDDSANVVNNELLK